MDFSFAGMFEANHELRYGKSDIFSFFNGDYHTITTNIRFGTSLFIPLFPKSGQVANQCILVGCFSCIYLSTYLCIIAKSIFPFINMAICLSIYLSKFSSIHLIIPMELCYFYFFKKKVWKTFDICSSS